MEIRTEPTAANGNHRVQVLNEVVVAVVMDWAVQITMELALLVTQMMPDLQMTMIKMYKTSFHLHSLEAQTPQDIHQTLMNPRTYNSE
jgi:hypothetical protein